MKKEVALALMSDATNPDDIRDIMKKSDYNDEVSRIGLTKISLDKMSEAELLSFMSESGYSPFVNAYCAPFLTLTSKTNKEILTLLERTKFEATLVETAFSVMTLDREDEYTIIKLLCHTNSKKVREICWPLLKIDTKSESELMELLRQLSSDRQSSLYIVRRIRQTNNLLDLIDKHKEDYYEDRPIHP